MPLTNAKLRALRAGDRPFKVSDAEGLFILVNPSGSKLWRLAYRYEGKHKLLAFGAYPDVTLHDARRRREAAKEMLEDSRDPSRERKIEKRRERAAACHTFESVANEWFDRQETGWVESYAVRLRRRLDADLIPELGSRPLASIEPIEVLDAIRKVEMRDAPEMARRIMQMASAIFRYGVATSRCARDPTADLRGALVVRKMVKSRAALSAEQLPEFLDRLDRYEGDAATRLALQLVLLTFVRSAELRFAEWSEFEGLSGREPVWRIPPERMKMRRAHLVPLAPQAVKALVDLRKLSGRSSLLFPAPTRSGVMSENTMIFALYRMGYHGRATVHGFRSTASTILNEHQFNRDWIEMQLAHAEGSVRSIYNQAQWLPGRRDMLNWWANYLDRLRELANGGAQISRGPQLRPVARPPRTRAATAGAR